VAFLTPGAVLAQNGHGVTIQKICTVSPRTCDSNADCTDNNACNGQETCNLDIPDHISCNITVTNADSFLDTLTVKNGFDVINPLAVDQTVIPNLPISAVSGTTTCVVGTTPLLNDASTWCTIAPGASVTFLSNTYQPTATDPNPLPDQGNVVVADLCNAPGTLNCNPATNTATHSGAGTGSSRYGYLVTAVDPCGAASAD